MPKTKTTYEVLIAASAEMSTEIKAVESVCRQYTRLHEREGIELVSRQWRKDGVPTLHQKAQDAINEQLVDPADIIVAMFWKFRGYATDHAESGTEEEINRFVAQDKPGAVYFSHKKVDATKIDPKQADRMEKLRSDLQGRMYTGEIHSASTFKDDLLVHLNSVVEKLEQVSGSALLTVKVQELETKLTALTTKQADAPPLIDHEKSREEADQKRQIFFKRVMDRSFFGIKADQDILAVSLIPDRKLPTPIAFSKATELDLYTYLLPLRTTHVENCEVFGEHAITTHPLRNPNRTSDDMPLMAATMIDADGAIFAVEDWDWYSFNTDEVQRRRQPHNYRMTHYQPAIINGVLNYLRLQRKMGVTGTIFAGVAILCPGQNSRLLIHDQQNYPTSAYGRPLGGQNLRARPVAITPDTDTSTFEAVQSALHPALRHIWREAGFPEVPQYSPRGEVTGFRAD